MKIKLISKRITAVLLSVAVIASAMVFQTLSVFATQDSVQNPTIWDGKKATTLAGDGSKANPYKITNGAELAKAVTSEYKESNGKYYVLTNDIYLNDVSTVDWYTRDGVKGWQYGCQPSGAAFSGKFDGQGYAIKGIYIDDSTFDKAVQAANAKKSVVKIGLFPGISGVAEIKNVGIEYSYIVSDAEYVNTDNPGSLVGAFVGCTHNWSGSADGFIFENCYVDDSVILEGVFVGGLVGRTVYKTKISNCISSAKITASRSAGGIIGDAFITWAYNNVFVHQCINTEEGINPVGNAINVVDFKDCYTAGTARTNVTKLTAQEMTGSSAAVNMKGLYFPQQWTVRDGKFPWPTVFEHLGADSESPVFSGDVKAYGMSTVSASLTWPEAVDSRSIPEKITYTLYKSSSPITDLAVAEKCGSFTGYNGGTVNGLTLGNAYYFAVTAADEVGNVSAPVYSSAYTHSWSSSDDWDGTAADGFVIGDGSAEHPYNIMNAEQLAYLVNLSNTSGSEATSGKYYTLTVDINLNDITKSDWKENGPKEWKYGTSKNISSAFAGNFDGQGHIIRGLYIKNESKQYNGLFAAVTENARISNLGIEDSYIQVIAENSDYSGALAGSVKMAATKNSVIIESCYASDTVAIEGNCAGGLVGNVAQNISIINSYSKADVKGAITAGTFVAEHSAKGVTVTIDGCYSNNSEIVVVGNTGEEAVVKYNNSYSASVSAAGLAKIDAEKMIGKNAKLYMGTFDFKNIWNTVEQNTPALAIFIPKAVWSGTVASEFAGGKGTKDEPYLISTAEQLAKLGNITSNGTYKDTDGKYYELTADIYLNDITGNEWYKADGIRSWLGTTGEFAGTLNGNGHVIYGIYINDDNAADAGLFRMLNKNASIMNLGIEYSYIKAKTNAGAFAGKRNVWGTVNITRCYSSDTVILSAGTNVGGLFGNAPASASATITFTDCYSSAQLATGQYIGGLAGATYTGAKYVRCYNTQDGIQLVKNSSGNAVYENCYTRKTIGVWNAATNKYTKIYVPELTMDQMQGSAARDNMQGFDFVTKNNQDATWYTVYGKTPQLKVFNDNDIDLTAPSFSGNIETLETTQIAITIGWPVATDNYTASEFIEYAVYYSPDKLNSGNIGSATKLGTFSSTLEATLGAVSLGDKYYFAVAAIDQAGNEAYIYTDKPIKTKKSETGVVWNGNIARSFEAGSGTKDDPYIIATAEQLARLAQVAFGDYKYYKLSDDILLNDVSDADWKNKQPKEWTPGTSDDGTRALNVVLDGDGHVVKGIYIEDKAKKNSGLFSYINGKAELHNLGVIESHISAYGSGSLAGALVGNRKPWTAGEGIKIIQCFSDETVEINSEGYVGGLLGGVIHNNNDVISKTLIRDCYSGAQLNASATKNKGSLVGQGYINEGTLIIENSFSNIPIIQMVASQYEKVAFKDCYSFGAVQDGITKVNIMNMLGKDADKYLTALDYENIWKTTDKGTPMLRVFGNHPEYAIDRLPVTITFETNGAGDIEPCTGYTGDKITLPEITREGYVFEGWYVYSSLDIKYPLDTYPGYDMTLYAKWTDLSVLRLDFEKYPYTEAGEDGLGEDYELYRPGVDDYDAKYVHGGGRSMHRLGKSDESSDFQLFDVDSKPLETGKNYKLTMWVYADEVTDGDIELVSTDRLKLSKKSSIVVQNVANVKNLKKGEWQEITVSFTAQGKYLRVRTPGLNSLYFDDISIYELSGGNDADNIINTDINYPKTGENNAVILGIIVFAVSGIAAFCIICYKRKLSKKGK